MKKLIHNFLSEYYSICGMSIKQNSDDRNMPRTAICRILRGVFDMRDKQIKWYVKSWVKKQNRGFDLNHYWNPVQFNWLKSSGFINAEQELSTQLALQMRLEIDRMLIEQMRFHMGIPANMLGEIDHSTRLPSWNLIFPPDLNIGRTNLDFIIDL